MLRKRGGVPDGDAAFDAKKKDAEGFAA